MFSLAALRVASVRRRRLALAALAVATGASLQSPLHASDHEWRGFFSSTNRNWGTAGNWDPTGAPPSDLVNTNIFYDAVTLPPGEPADVLNSTLNAPWSIRSIYFRPNANPYVVNGSTLTIGGGGIRTDSSQVQRFDNAVLLGADQTWVLSFTSPGLTFNGGLNTSGGPGNLPRVLTLQSGAFNAGQINVINGNITGAGSLVKVDRGLVALTGANTYTGGTTITNGTLRLDSAGALGTTGPITITGGVLRHSAANAVDYSARFSTTPGQSLLIDTNGRFVSYGSPIVTPNSTLAKAGAGELRLTQPNAFAGNVNVDGGTLSVSGTMQPENLFIRPGGTFRAFGNAVINQQINRQLYLYGNGSALGSLDIADNAAISASGVHVGHDGGGVVNQSGGTFSTGNGILGGPLVLAISSDDTGTYNLSGGTVTNPERTQIANTTNSVGIFNQTGGTHRSPVIRLTGETATATGTYHLTAGTLETASIIGSQGNSTFNFNGGVLKLTANSSELVQGLTRANVGFRGVRVDTNGFYGFVNQPLLHDTSFGPGLDGGLAMYGSGTLILSAANTYDGGTTISDGSLLLRNASGSGTGTGRVDVLAGGTLAGAAALSGPVIVSSGGSISPGDPYGALSTGTITFMAGGTTEVELGGTAAARYDQLNVTGTVTLRGDLMLRLDYAAAIGDTFTIVRNDGTDAISGTFATVNGAALVGNTFAIGPRVFSINYAGGGSANGNNDVVLMVTAVPEPAGAAAGLLAVIGLARRRRSRSA